MAKPPAELRGRRGIPGRPLKERKDVKRDYKVWGFGSSLWITVVGWFGGLGGIWPPGVLIHIRYGFGCHDLATGKATRHSRVVRFESSWCI